MFLLVIFLYSSLNLEMIYFPVELLIISPLSCHVLATTIDPSFNSLLFWDHILDIIMFHVAYIYQYKDF